MYVCVICCGIKRQWWHWESSVWTVIVKPSHCNLTVWPGATVESKLQLKVERSEEEFYCLVLFATTVARYHLHSHRTFQTHTHNQAYRSSELTEEKWSCYRFFRSLPKPYKSLHAVSLDHYVRIFVSVIISIASKEQASVNNLHSDHPEKYFRFFNVNSCNSAEGAFPHLVAVYSYFSIIILLMPWEKRGERAKGKWESTQANRDFLEDCKVFYNLWPTVACRCL